MKKNNGVTEEAGVNILAERTGVKRVQTSL